MAKEKKSSSVTADDILGKIVLGHEGKPLGMATKLHLDKKKKSVLGITIDQGMIKPNIFVGINHIENFGDGEVLIMKKTPIEAYIGHKVFTDGGVFLGYLADVKIVRENSKSLLIKKRKFLAGKKSKFLIDIGFVRNLGKNIVIRKNFSFEELKPKKEKEKEKEKQKRKK